MDRRPIVEALLVGWLHRLVRVIPLLGLLSLASPAVLAAQGPIEVVFDHLGDSSGQAVASIANIDGTVSLTVQASGLEPGAHYSVQTHAGTCEQPSASTGFLGTLDADASGNAGLISTEAETSASGVMTPLDFILDGPHTLDIFRAPDTHVCQNLPGAPANNTRLQ